MNEFKDIAHYYIGSGLELIDQNDADRYTIDQILRYAGRYDRFKSTWDIIQNDNHLPVLYPLSCLSVEITAEGHNEGKPFIPKERIELSYDFDWLQISSYRRWDFLLVELLIDWHFNVFNLPEDQFINKKSLEI